VEKPVVATEEQAKLLERLLGGLSACPATLVGCNLRHLPSLQRVRGLLQSGAIGQPVRASFQVGQWLPDWRPAQDYRLSYSADPGRGGGVALDLVHEFDAARWLFGEFDQVFAVGGHYSRLEIGSEDSATILLGRTGGPAVAVGLDYVARQPMRRYEIIGDEGTLVWDLVGRRLEHASPNGNELIDCGEAGFETAATYVTAMTKMLAAVRSRQPTSQDIVDGLCSVRLALNVNHQLRS
jgi:predicted dehydrogenase